MRVKDAEEVGHVVGRELRTADPMFEKEGVSVVVGAMYKHLQYKYGDAQATAFIQGVHEAEMGEWS